MDSAAVTNSARLRGGQASGTVTISGRRDQSGFDSATANFAAATISDLPSADDGPVGETYQRNFSVLGTNRAATVSGTGCSLAEDTALRVGTTRHYTLSAKRSGPGKLSCTITADTASHTITITFNPINIEGLEATGTGNVGTTYQDPFSVTGTNRAATVSGTGCSLVEDTALRVGTTRLYTLSATATEAGEITCTITVGTVSQTATIEFAAPPPPAALGAPTGLGCTWPTQAKGAVECLWNPVTGATGGYKVEYEMILDLRGNIRTIPLDRDISDTKFSIGMNRFLTKTRLRAAAVGPDGTGPYTAWATAAKPAPCLQDSALLVRSGLSNHRHGQDACHIHETAKPLCSASEDRAYTVHVQAPNAPEPVHRQGVVLACHPGHGQGVVSPQPLSVTCTADGEVNARWAWPSTPGGTRRITASKERFEVEGDLTHLSRWSRTSDRQSDELLSKTWDGAPSVSYTIRVRMIWAQAGKPPIEGPWTVTKTTTCPANFRPRNVTAECNSYGVVEANWKAVNGANSYRVDWRPQHEVGSDEIRTTADVDPSWQEDEGGIYQLAVSAYAVANSMWSDYSDPVTVICDEVMLPGVWLSPNTPGYDPEDARSSIYFNELVTRFCPVTVTGDRTVRTCTEVWNEAVLISLGGQSWWKKIPLTKWSNLYDAANNVKTLIEGALILRGRLSSGSISTQAQVKIAKIGHKQGQATLIVGSDGSQSLVLSAHFPGPNPPVAGQPLITGCIEPTYVHRSITLERITVTHGNHTNHRDVTIHYCIRSDLAPSS